MELTVTQENISKALSIIGRIATTKTQLPILSNILLKTDGNRLLIASTNLEIASTQFIGAKIIKPGSITIPARLITDFMSNLPKETVELKVIGENLHIKCMKYNSIINGQIADDFPELPTINEKSSIHYSIKPEDFKQAVGQTLITVSTDTTRPVLTGIYWHNYEGNLVLAATDGYRLAERILLKTKSEINAIIPAPTMNEVLKLITEDVDEVDILFDETQVRFRVNESEIISRLIDGNFPDYRQLIPKKSETVIEINKNDLMRINKIAGLFARESGGSITISANEKNKTLSVHSIASELGENTSETQAKIKGEGQITLNSKYLTDALNVLDGENITFGFSGKLSPCLLKSKENEDNYYHIIMPLKS